MKLGIDFGSTYSTVATCDSEGNVKTLTPGQAASPSIPSVVSIDGEELNFGVMAKDNIGEEDVRVFEGFKMLLVENNREILRSRGYDERFTPKYISTCFLNHLLTIASKRGGATTADSIDGVVICVPEIWGKDLKNLSGMDGRVILRDILRDGVDIENRVKDVRVVTEPEAASAYFAYNYNRNAENTPFNGYLLLIDYGGGTLDITLTEVLSKPDGTMEICYQESGGAGENHKNEQGNAEIGSAGITFMQEAVLLATRDIGITPPDNLNEPAFAKAVRILEGNLIYQKSSDVEVFFGRKRYSEFKLFLKQKPEKFCDLRYRGKKIPVTYQHLLRAYQEKIEPVLAYQVKKINEKIVNHIGSDPCSREAGRTDKFKIALVGGFGSFYLVKKQLQQIYNIDTNPQRDPRIRGISEEMREQAIALGAALIADERVVLQRTAKYSVGVYLATANGVNRLFYGIKKRQILAPNTPYMIKYDNGENVRIWYSKIRNLVIEYSDDLTKGGLVPLKQKFIDKLKTIPCGFCNCGLSVDNNDILTFWVFPENSGKKANPIELDNFESLFDTSAITEVHV